jgi:hypothetical protein
MESEADISQEECKDMYDITSGKNSCVKFKITENNCDKYVSMLGFSKKTNMSLYIFGSHHYPSHL